MITYDQILKQQQLLARSEKILAFEKIKKRRADTRRKIELGGLVIKSGIDGFSKLIILGALDYSLQLLSEDENYKKLFESKGYNLFRK